MVQKKLTIGFVVCSFFSLNAFMKISPVFKTGRPIMRIPRHCQPEIDAGTRSVKKQVKTPGRARSSRANR